MKNKILFAVLMLLTVFAHSMAFDDEAEDARMTAAMFPKMKYVGVWAK